MPNPNLNSPTSPGSGALPDTQTLIALLSSLLPLLQRMQAQMSVPPLTSPDQSLLGQGSPFGQPNPAAPNPVVDHQAAVSFVEDITADSLRNLSTYLDAHAEHYSELGPCVAVVTQAARCLAMRDYAQAFGLIWQAYRVIAAARMANPQLPTLRAGQAGVATATPIN
jgi:hypothetical protein